MLYAVIFTRLLYLHSYNISTSGVFTLLLYLHLGHTWIWWIGGCCIYTEVDPAATIEKGHKLARSCPYLRICIMLILLYLYLYHAHIAVYVFVSCPYRCICICIMPISLYSYQSLTFSSVLNSLLIPSLYPFTCVQHIFRRGCCIQFELMTYHKRSPSSITSVK